MRNKKDTGRQDLVLDHKDERRADFNIYLKKKKKRQDLVATKYQVLLARYTLTRQAHSYIFSMAFVWFCRHLSVTSDHPMSPIEYFFSSFQF